MESIAICQGPSASTIKPLRVKPQMWKIEGNNVAAVTEPNENFLSIGALENLGAYTRLLMDGQFKSHVLGSDSVTLWAGRGLTHNFEGHDRRIFAGLKQILESPEGYNDSDTVLINDKFLLYKTSVKGNHYWKLIPKHDGSLTKDEKQEIEKTFGLKFKLPKFESYSNAITRRTMRGDGSVKKIRAKLPDPTTCKEDEFLLPYGKKLYLRTSKGERVWALVPENNKSLTEAEIEEVESFLELKFKYELPKVTKDDIICWEDSAVHYFVGNKINLQKTLKSKLPDPYTHEGNKFTPKDFPSIIVFKKKVNRVGMKVWTTEKSMHKTASEYLGLRRKNFLPKVPEDAIICWGERSQGYWIDAGENGYDLKLWHQRIKDEIGNPYEYDDNYIVIRSDSFECKVYLGERKVERFWYVTKDDYRTFAIIFGAKPKLECKAPDPVSGNNGDELVRLMESYANRRQLAPRDDDESNGTCQRTSKFNALFKD